MGITAKRNLDVPINRILEARDGLFCRPTFGEDIQIDAFCEIQPRAGAVIP